MEPYTKPRLTPRTIDVFVVRSTIFEAVKNAAPYFSGTLLDVGCGYMPYRELVLSTSEKISNYIGLDFAPNTIYNTKPDLIWDGQTIPLPKHSVDCAMATELFEHCPAPEAVLKEISRVLKPGGILFFTVPFLWPLHDVPHDEYRYTPFSLARHLRNSGFDSIELKALGGWNASMAQMLGLWVRRGQKSCVISAVLSVFALPLVWLFAKTDKPPSKFFESQMLTGISGVAINK